MVEGYSDGFNLDNPEPSANRSYSYRHGFANGRADKTHKRIAQCSVLRVRAAEAIEKDAGA